MKYHYVNGVNDMRGICPACGGFAKLADSQDGRRYCRECHDDDPIGPLGWPIVILSGLLALSAIVAVGTMLMQIFG